MVDENILAKLYAVAEVADKRRQNSDIVELSLKKFFEKLDVFRIVGQAGGRLGAERPCAKHFLDGFLKITLCTIRRTALIHQFIDIAGLEGLSHGKHLWLCIWLKFNA